MKRILALLVAITVLAGCITVFATPVLTAQPYQLYRRTITITGTAPAGSHISLLLSTAEQVTDPNQVVVMADTIAAEDGTYSVSFYVPDTLRNGESTNNKTLWYRLGVAGVYEQQVVTSFTHVHPIELREAMIAIDGASEAKTVFELLQTKPYQDLLTENKFEMGLYTQSLSEEARLAICQALVDTEIGTETNFTEAVIPMINEKILCAVLTEAEKSKIHELLTTYDYQISLTGGDDYTKFPKEVTERVAAELANKTLTSYDSVSAAIEDTYFGYQLENTAYQNLHTLLTKYQAAYGISESNLSYVSGLSSTNRSNIYKNFKSHYMSNDTYTTEDVNTVLQWAIDNTTISNENVSSGGGGFAGTGGISAGQGAGAVSITGEQAAIPQEYEKNHSNNPFRDMEEYEWAEEAVGWLYDQGVVKGVDIDIFEPGRNVTRAEFIKMLMVGFRLTVRSTILQQPLECPDVKRDDWHYFYIASAAYYGIVTGYEDGTFRPDDSITREEMATLLYRTSLQAKVGYQKIEEAKVTFSDQGEISDWALTPILTLNQHGIIFGMEDGSFAPGRNANRAEAAAMLYRLMVDVIDDDYLPTDVRI